jgi:hypothetical protein
MESRFRIKHPCDHCPLQTCPCDHRTGIFFESLTCELTRVYVSQSDHRFRCTHVSNVRSDFSPAPAAAWITGAGELAPPRRLPPSAFLFIFRNRLIIESSLLLLTDALPKPNHQGLLWLILFDFHLLCRQCLDPRGWWVDTVPSPPILPVLHSILLTDIPLWPPLAFPTAAPTFRLY